MALMSLIDQLAGGSRFFDEQTAVKVEAACSEIEEIINRLESELWLISDNFQFIKFPNFQANYF